MLELAKSYLQKNVKACVRLRNEVTQTRFSASTVNQANLGQKSCHPWQILYVGRDQKWKKKRNYGM